ncbi:MAG: hypothetical protein Q9207_006302 [Kuettlingeria erythrocarpa]
MHALAAPSEVKFGERALPKNCNRDNLFRSFIDPRYSASSSGFCNTYIRLTVKSTITATTTLIATNGKRDLPATNSYPSSRLSSACSCILTASPSPTNLITTKIITATTTTKPSTCSVATPIVPNGDFETGSLAPWTQTYSNNGDPKLLTYSIKRPGYNASAYALIANDNAASSYIELDFEQSLTVCSGTKYDFAARYYITDPETPQSSKHKRQVNKQVYVQVMVDGVLVALSQNSDPAGPPIVWRTFRGTFVAGTGRAGLKVSFIATDFVGVEWGVDDVVITPV